MNSIDAFRSDLRDEEAPSSILIARKLGWVGIGVGASLLGVAITKRNSRLGLVGALAVLGGAVSVVVARSRQMRPNTPVMYSVTINKSPLEVYEFFRDFSRLPEFMDFLVEVTETDSLRSTWVAKPMGGMTISWDAEITDDVPGEVIAWRSVSSKVRTSGKVTFAKAPGRDATEVRVEMELGGPLVGTSSALAKMFAKPQIKGDLRRLKQVLETGEVLVSDATVTLRPRPAQPADVETIVKNEHVLKPIAKQLDHINTNTDATDAAKENLPVTSDRVNANGGAQ